VVTGASDGIGKSYAKQLAKRGFNIVLISRTQSKLQAVAEEISKETSNKVQTRVVVADLTNTDPAKYDEIAKQIADLDVSVLINNAGLSFEYPDFFLNVDATHTRNIVAVNIIAVNEMTRIVLPKLVEKCVFHSSSILL
jgi:17beta-estradiol 17-dehydrogenase / very-long-chain 3-oxoacyl-CoA reductase